MASMFQLIFSGPMGSEGACLDAFGRAGFPVQVAEVHGGFAPEEGTVFVEAIASGPDHLPQAVTLAASVGFVLRLHGEIADRPADDPLALRVAALEARLALLETSKVGD
jgi:hypothetical protein